MLYAILHQEGALLGRVLWRDLKTVQGCVRRARRAMPNHFAVGESAELRIYRSEQPGIPLAFFRLTREGDAKIAVKRIFFPC